MTIAMVQKEYLPSPNDKKIGKWAIEDAMLRAADAGDVVSPLKRGPKVRIHTDLTYALATHSTMMQVVANGEAKVSVMKAIASAVVFGTHHKGEMSMDYLWRKTRESHPEIMNPVKAENHENHCVDWLSYKNLMQWNKRAKQFLIDIGMAQDVPGIIREIVHLSFSFSLHESHPAMTIISL